MPAHLTYSSLRNTLIVHVEELERRLASYYSAVGHGPSSSTLDYIVIDARHAADAKPQSDDVKAEAAGIAAAALATGPASADSPGPPPQHNRSSSTSSIHSLTPDHLLSLISNLREDITTHLPRLPSMANLHAASLPPVREPLEKFLAGLPSRLHQVHASLPSMPRSTSFTGKIPDLSLHPTSPLGMGSQQILTLLDSILPDVSDKAAEAADLGLGRLGGFPVFPNRTPRRHPAFERVLMTERRAKARREGGGVGGEESSGDEEVVLKVIEQRAPTVEDALRKAQTAPGGLIQYDDLPTLWQNNEYVVKGYRCAPMLDSASCVPSMCADACNPPDPLQLHHRPGVAQAAELALLHAQRDRWATLYLLADEQHADSLLLHASLRSQHPLAPHLILCRPVVYSILLIYLPLRPCRRPRGTVDDGLDHPLLIPARRFQGLSSRGRQLPAGS
jgi:hypothetical protein